MTRSLGCLCSLRSYPLTPSVITLVVVLSALSSLSNAFYLPGLAPVNYCQASEASKSTSKSKCLTEIPVFVNRLDSVESVLPYEYTHFDFCESTTDQPPSENLGQVIFGERIHSSPYKFKFQEAETCKPVCVKKYDGTKNKADKAKLNFLRKGVVLNYQHHWIVDNMPVTWCYDTDGNERFCATGKLTNKYDLTHVVCLLSMCSSLGPTTPMETKNCALPVS